MLISAPGLPKSLWADAINITVYLTNRSLIKALPKGRISHELLYGTMPRYRHIKTFGCAAYALKPYAKDEGKMALQSEKLWLLGYEASTIFRLWDSVKKAVRISRNVTFKEAELAASPTSLITSPTIELIPESNAESNVELDIESNAESEAESDAESDTDSNAESSIKLTD
jgi:hypothetical protein